MRQENTPPISDYLTGSALRYGIAVAAVICAALLRMPLTGLLGSKAAFITFYPAVMLAATLCGLRAGILATVLAALAADYWILPPVGRFGIENAADALTLVIFILMGGFMSSVAGLYHRARSKASQYEVELARREGEAQYRELVQNANSAIIRYKREGTITFINEYAQRFFGYSEEEVIGRSVMMFVPDVDSTGVDLTALCDDVVSHPEAYINNINENVLRDGSRVWMTWTNRPIFDEQGQVIEMLTVGSDITEQKRTEEALHESESREKARAAELQAFIDAVPGIVFIAHDPECRNMTGSRATNEFLRVPLPGNVSKSAIGNEKPVSFRAMKNGAEIPPEQLPVQQAAKGRDVRDYELDIVFSDGVVRTILGNARPVLDENGAPRGAVGAFVDVTQQKRTEDELAESKARAEQHAAELQVVLDSVPVAVWIAHDPECKQITGNAYADDLVMSVPRGGNISRSAPPDEAAISYAVFRSGVELKPEELPAQVAAATGKPVADEAIDLVFSDGRVVHMLTGAVPLFDAEGHVRGSLTVGLDVTRLKQSEDTMRELEAHKREFYRRTILAATEGKLMISEPGEIDKVAGPAMASWQIGSKPDAEAAVAAASRLSREAGMEEQRSYEFVGCITEAITNVIKHAKEGEASLHKVENSLICVISDRGPGIGTMALPDVALTRNYSTAGTLGMGYKLMIHFADRVYLATGPEGTTVAIEMGLHRNPAQATPPQIAGWKH